MAWNPRPLADFSCKEGWGKGGKGNAGRCRVGRRKKGNAADGSGQPTQK